MKQSIRDMFVFRGTANPEVVLATIQPRKWVRGVVELWEVKLVICWQKVATIFIFFKWWSAAVWDSRGRAIRAGVVGVRRATSCATCWGGVTARRRYALVTEEQG
jgi:hypothetical protein